MSGIFHRRKPSNSNPSELDAATALLSHQTNENKELKRKIEDLRETSKNNKTIFEEFIKKNQQSEREIEELKTLQENFMDKIKEQEFLLKDLREIKFQLITDKDASNPRANTFKKIQDLLDLVDNKSETLIFKDFYDRTWEIIKRNDIILNETALK
jgi:predicted RNase H-like nuclease (RuvC/YqgF family)